MSIHVFILLKNENCKLNFIKRNYNNYKWINNFSKYYIIPYKLMIAWYISYIKYIIASINRYSNVYKL